MAADPRVDQPGNSSFTTDIMRAETHVQFEDGMEVTDALKTSQLMLRRNQDPGYTGHDHPDHRPERAEPVPDPGRDDGPVRHFAGLGDEGMNLHITEAQPGRRGGPS
jgi:hypothetical protein